MERKTKLEAVLDSITAATNLSTRFVEKRETIADPISCCHEAREAAEIVMQNLHMFRRFPDRAAAVRYAALYAMEVAWKDVGGYVCAALAYVLRREFLEVLNGVAHKQQQTLLTLTLPDRKEKCEVVVSVVRMGDTTYLIQKEYPDKSIVRTAANSMNEAIECVIEMVEDMELTDEEYDKLHHALEEMHKLAWV